MKKMSYFILTIVSLIIFSQVSARQIVVINGIKVRFRTSMDTSSTGNIIREFNTGDELELIDKDAGATSACSKWYKVSYNNQEGYVCGDYAIIKDAEETVNPEDFQEYSEYLNSLGFPDSYIPYLINLHNSHPNWQFKVLRADISFDRMVKLEHDGLEPGWSLFEDTGRYYDGYKATDSWGYSYLTDVFRSNYEGGGVNRWYAPNTRVISYYLDPRNFLTNNYIFMFETLSYKPEYQTREVVELMLKGTFMATGYADSANEKTYVDAFIDAALALNVSPYALVSRVIQEVGANGSTIVSGTVPGYEGYYNFYNIQAYGNTSSETIRRGLEYAKSQGWNTPYKAIIGGGNFLATSYIGVGQDTFYLQKWDIFGPKPATHQYMQNVQAPVSEAVKTYNGYTKSGLIDSNFMFVIPVYDNMPDKTNLPDRGNPNNYLSSLVVNDTTLLSGASEKTDFELTLASNVTSIEIKTKTVNSKASVRGVGSVSVDNELTEIPIVVTAENGDIRNYKINITRVEVVNKTITDVINELNMRVTDNYLVGLVVGEDVTKLSENIKKLNNNINVTFLNKDGNNKTSGLIASGDKIKLTLDLQEVEYTLVIYGDANGDGKIAASDYVMIKNHIMDVNKLNEFEIVCADVNHDNKISASDYVMIKNHIMDVNKIVQ